MSVEKRLSFTNEIKCPGCGWVYKIEEIFFFDDLIENKPEQTYICDNCGRTLKIKAMLKFSTIIDEELETAQSEIPTYKIEDKDELCLESSIKDSN